MTQPRKKKSYFQRAVQPVGAKRKNFPKIILVKSCIAKKFLRIISKDNTAQEVIKIESHRNSQKN